MTTFARLNDLIAEHKERAAGKRYKAPKLPDLDVKPAKARANKPRPGQPLRVNNRRVG